MPKPSRWWKVLTRIKAVGSAQVSTVEASCTLVCSRCPAPVAGLGRAWTVTIPERGDQCGVCGRRA